MNPSQPSVRDLFDRAAEIESPTERRAYLDEACAGDAKLRTEVESLLGAHAKAGSFLGKLAAEQYPVTDASSRTGLLSQGPLRENAPDDTQAESIERQREDLNYLAPPRVEGALGALGHYDVLETIGKGGFGTVFKAHDTKLRRIVAIKVLAPELAANGSARKRFIREAQAAAAIKNEHVVAIYNVEDDHQPPYIVMEMIDGISLQDRLDKDGSLELKEILRIGLQMVEGLAAAHKQGLIHRDIKPANILLENGVQRVKITDFGLARLTDDASITQSGVIAGTPMYMAPEQAMGEQLDRRADLFSLGSVLYVLCTGHPPFRAANTMAVLKRVCEETPRSIREINPEVPDWLEAIVARLHAKKPEERFQTAKEVAELLGQHLADVQAGRAAIPSVRRLAPIPGTPAPAVLPRSRRRRVLVAASLLFVGVLVVIGIATDFFGLAPWASVSATKKVSPDDGTSFVRAFGGPDWRQLYDGKSYAGWKAFGNSNAGRGDFLLFPGGAVDTLDKMPRNFHLRMEVNLVRGQGTLRFHAQPRTEQFTQPLPRDGWFLNFTENPTDEGMADGELLAKNPAQPEAIHTALASSMAKLRDWFYLEVIAKDESTDVLVNGNKVMTLKHPDFVPTAGVISLWNNGRGDAQIAFRNIEIKELSPNSPPPAVAPFNASKAKEHQEAWAKHLGVEPEFTNSIGMKLRLIPPGKFLMGSPDDEPGRDAHEGPQHDVVITRPFYTGVHDVTVGQFKAFVKATGYQTEAEKSGGAVRVFRGGKAWQNDPQANWQNPAFDQTDDHPVVCVSWNDARAYCKWLSDKEGKKYALLTEAQWEYSCRAGSSTKFYFGDDDRELAQYAWYDANSEGKTHPVRQKKPNAWGLYDMHGNVWQWTADWYNSSYYEKGPKEDPPGPGTGSTRVLRGGCLIDVPSHSRAAHRHGFISVPSNRFTNVGFRVVLVGDLRASPPLAVAPFNAAKAKEHQEAWARHLGVEPEITNSFGMKLRLIPPGEFMMGSPADERWARIQEGPRHAVTLTDPFYLGIHDVTVQQFRTFVKESGYRTEADTGGGAFRLFAGGEMNIDPEINWQNAGFAQTNEHPVVCASWKDAKAFCDWLSKKEGRKYVLPSETQWEYACRAGAASKFYFGDGEELLNQHAWNIANAKLQTHPVGLKQPNPWGLYDMCGNVWQWTADWYSADYYSQRVRHNPPGPSEGRTRVFRGGSWNCIPADLRAANRGQNDRHSSYRDTLTGFRVALVGDLKSKTPLGVDDAWVKRVAALPAAQQVDEVAAKLKDLNPGFDGEVKHKIDDGVVTELRFLTDKVTNISPIQVFNGLRVLDFSGTFTDGVGVNGQLAELAPLKGMNLTGLLELGLNYTKVNDAGMAHFKDCEKLTHLLLTGTQVSDAGLAHFKNCKNLTWLGLGYTRVSDEGLANFKDCKNIMILGLSDKQVSDAGLAHFKNCKNLTYLALVAGQASDAGMAHFKDCQNLTHLDLDGTKRVGDAGLAHFKDCKNLSELFLSGTQVSDVGLTHLKDYKSLTHLRLTKTKVTAAMIEELKKALPGCKIEWDGVDDAWIKQVSAMPAEQQVDAVAAKLKDLNPGFDGKVTHKIDDGVVTELRFLTDNVTNISPIQVFNGLRIFDCSGTATADWRGNGQLADLTPLKGMNLAGLMELQMSWTKVSDAGLAYFKDCKNLEHLVLNGTKASTAGLVHFEGCKKLTVLWLNGTQVSDTGLAYFKDCKNLGSLWLGDTQVSDTGLAHFKGCKNLLGLNLNGTKVNNAGLAYFKDCKNLKELQLHGTQVSDAGLAHFTGCKSFTYLEFTNVQVSDDGLAHFKDCKNLTYLNLYGTKVSDVGLRHFMDCKELMLLDLRKTKVTAAKIEELKKALPACKIEWDGAPAKADTQPFVIMGTKEQPDRSFATLKDAVDKTENGDTIEIRGDGPFNTGPLDLKAKNLVIRSGRCFRPVLKQTPETITANGPMFNTSGVLVLEGLELHRTGSLNKGWLSATVASYGSSLYVANCRFLSLVNPKGQMIIIAQSSDRCEIRNSLFIAGTNVSLGGIDCKNRRQVSLDNNLSVSTGAGLTFNIDPDPKGGDVAISIQRNTFVHGLTMVLIDEQSLMKFKDKKYPRLRFDLKESIVDPRQNDWPSLLTFHQSQGLNKPEAKDLVPEKAEELLQERLTWSEQKNLFADGAPALGLLSRWQVLPPVKDRLGLAGWNAFWNLKDTGSIEGQPRYQGGDLLAKAKTEPEKITSADFGLVKGSPGQGVLPDGKDLGADVDLVGPGAAYERWQKSQAYLEWRKKTDKLMISTQP